MGVVIRMNMAAGLGRAELSWAQAAVRNRCLLTHICQACWDIGVSGHGSDHLRDTVHLGPKRSLAQSVPWKLSDCLSAAAVSHTCLSLCHAYKYPDTHVLTLTGVQIHIFLAWRTHFRLWSQDQRFWPTNPPILWPTVVKSGDEWMWILTDTTLKLKGKVDEALAINC